MATIIYNDDPIDVSEGTQGALWVRTWYTEDIVATDRVNAIAELFLALPDRGTSAPAPLNPNLRVISNRVTWIEGLNGSTGKAKGTTTNSTPVDTITAEPPQAGVEDTGPGITLSGSGYIQQRKYVTARPQGSGSVEQCTVRNSDGNLSPVLIDAPEFGETFTFSRNEETNPRARLRTLRGRVNDATWNTYAVDTVLLQNASYQSVNGGEYYAVTYQFATLPSGWVVVVTGRDLEKGGAPILAPTGDEQKIYVPYDRADFSVLGIVLD